MAAPLPERHEAETDLSPQTVTSQFQFTIPNDHPALPGHFPGRPIVPGVLLLDWVLAGVAAESKRRVQTLRQVKFAAAMLPGETARVAFDARDSQVKFCVDVMRGGASVILATGSLLLADAAAPEPRADAP